MIELELISSYAPHFPSHSGAAGHQYGRTLLFLVQDSWLPFMLLPILITNTGDKWPRTPHPCKDGEYLKQAPP